MALPNFVPEDLGENLGKTTPNTIGLSVISLCHGHKFQYIPVDIGQKPHELSPWTLFLKALIVSWPILVDSIPSCIPYGRWFSHQYFSWRQILSQSPIFLGKSWYTSIISIISIISRLLKGDIKYTFCCARNCSPLEKPLHQGSAPWLLLWLTASGKPPRCCRHGG